MSMPPPLAESVPTLSSAQEPGARQAQLTLILKTLFANVPSVSVRNPFAGLTVATVPQQVKLEVAKLVDVTKYKRPASSQEALARIRANVAFFRLTYSFVASIIVFVYVLSNIGLLITVAALAALWSWFLAQPADAVTTVGSVQLKRGEKLLVLVGLSVLTVLFGGLFSAVFYVGLETAVVIGAHGAMREAIELDALEQLQLENEKLVAPAGDVV